MMIDNPPEPLDRINHRHLVAPMLEWAVAACRLDRLLAFDVNEVGYDDCNLLLVTSTGRYFAKVFTAARTHEMCRRYVDVLEAVLGAGVCHPRLHTVDGQALLEHVDSGNRLVVMDVVRGQSFFDLSTYPRDDETGLVFEQVHRIHSLPIRPQHVHDWWAIPQIGGLAEEMLPRLPIDDRAYIRAAADAFTELDLQALPHVFSHGDLTKTNVMRNLAGGVSVIDFAVSNLYPRVHDLAMLIVNLLDGEPTPIPSRIKRVAEWYGRRSPLTAAETAALPVYVFAAAAMELLGAHREWSTKGNRSNETRFLLDLGRRTVRAAAL